MIDRAPSHFSSAVRPFTWMDAPRILATFLVVGFCALFVVGFFLCPQLDQGREEARNSMYRAYCREAQTALSVLPAEQRLSQWPIIGRLPPNLVVIDMSTLEGLHRTLRATLTEPNGEIVRTFVLRESAVPLTDGLDDYTIESANLSLASIKAQRRRQWIIFLAVWLTTSGFITWPLLKSPSVAAAGSS